ncbi:MULTISPECIES: putative lipid II flippase FtsW [Rhodococcus]|uniref:Probable peptidoglycan glycosyltransferase FtsW n=2 Tax=Rhodococcus rhodochrous TaxID=1829 RepID=A0AA47AEQ9_RHORH|nr:MULTISPECIES: putative lipid II flippase FtsW [Rhodococcus]MCB8908899.1 putative lipid II flippase FtsW [Rhodococcus rhodochrous]MCD2096096.1 putative lipid II flippase FtsW [Rhodococcus rhodochrous]MCD2120854.1 putative lipid II flippase FtsW [Rhodococcus rhodochrous]MCQ4137547.1 putative lipid II flippase FtsW [Rhodococcus rhodochrous]MDC3727839.1 putative lipid II flippase FtsW [Rhodococcus sp. Rp3]
MARPLASFHLVVTIAVLLTVLGLVMVLSSSSVGAVAAAGSAYGLFTSQVIFAVLGMVIFYIALQIPVRLMRRFAFPAFAFSVVLLVLVLIPGIGTVSQGTRGWFVIAGISLQPAEIAKITLAVWGAHLLASRRGENSTLREMLVPLVPAALLVTGLIVLQPDLGTTVSIVIIVIALLWFAGLPLKVFLGIVGTAATLAVILALTAGYRSQRVRAFFNPGDDPQGAGYQARQAKFSLADGGLWGRGLGQSRAKWSYLPNAHNDFIFAIIGEELGFLGGVAVIGLFGLFAYVGLRIAMRSADPFLRLFTATATTWIIGQAFINIGYVVGLLPVTGLQLPLVSAGGTSTATTLLMFGLIANAARHEPEAIAALHAGQDGRFARLLRLRKPEAYRAGRSSAARTVAARQPRARAAAPERSARPASGGGGSRTRKPQVPNERQRRAAQDRRGSAGRTEPREGTGRARRAQPAREPARGRQQTNRTTRGSNGRSGERGNRR